MGVIYKPLDGEKVSRVWHRLLTDLRTAGVQFRINEGHRTYARQWQLVRAQGVWSFANPHGAARPTPWAPHIRTGRYDHALDMDDRYVAGFIKACRDRGVTVTRTVPGEPWHVEANAAQLLRYYRKRVAQILRRRRRRRRKAAKR